MRYSFIFRAILFCSVLLGSALPSFCAQKTEYEAKAIVLVTLLKYIDFNDTGDTFDIGVIGDNPFNGHLKDFNGIEVKDRKIRIHFLGNDLKRAAKQNCHFYFISKSEVLNQKDIINKLGNLRGIIFGDNKWFLKSGGMINLHIQKNKVRWNSNKKEIDKKNVKVHYQIYEQSLNKGAVK